MEVLTVVLASILALIFCYTREPSVMREVRRRNKIMAREVGHAPSHIVSLRPDGPELGWNIGKGWSMAVCTRGDIDAIMHVLIHEMAHTDVEVIDHSEEWESARRDFVRVARDLGIYSNTVKNKQLCGDIITEES